MNNMLPEGARCFFITATRRNEKINPLFLCELCDSSEVFEAGERVNQRSEVGRRTSEIRGRMSEVGKKKSEDYLTIRIQRSEGRGQSRSQMSNVRCQISTEPVSMNNMLPAACPAHILGMVYAHCKIFL